MKLKSVFFLIGTLFFIVFGCEEATKVKPEIAGMKLRAEVVRFDRIFAQASETQIPQLREDYPYLFPQQYPDSVWGAKMNDSVQQEIFNEVNQTFGDFESQTEDITLLFKHIKYYFPKFEPPKVITLTSDVAYDNRIILADSLLLIGLDNYLGADHKFYRSFSRYITQQLDQAYLTSDIAAAFAKSVNAYPRDRSFLSRMVYYGKELYLKELLLPTADDFQYINFTYDEYQWATENERQVWRYFIENELLYSTDTKLNQRFLDPAPFSKFQLELIDSESPGRIGRFIGWQIVRAFAKKNPDLTLIDLLDLPADELFKKSNYKPKK